MATAEAQKVLPGPEPKPGTQEMSLAESIVRLLEPLPLPYKLRVLKEAERLITAGSKGLRVRKVTRRGRSLAVTVPTEAAGRYKLEIDKGAGALVYIRNEHGDIVVRNYKLPVPKGAWEEIGRPEYVVVEVLDDKIILMPA